MVICIKLRGNGIRRLGESETRSYRVVSKFLRIPVNLPWQLVPMKQTLSFTVVKLFRLRRVFGAESLAQ
jgi:hypothetical protein